MELHVFDNKELLCDQLTRWMEQDIATILKTSERYTIALSGGSTPKLLYQKLALSKHIDWSRVHFFWGDERTVPFSDERNNARMAFEELLDKINVAKSNIHVMNTDVPVTSSVQEYERLLHSYFDGRQSSFDLVLLGMGDDGHTLSVFPGGNLLNDTISWVASTEKAGEDISRITVMPAIVNKAKNIVFLVSGKDKAPMIKNVLELDPFYPANLIDPASGGLHWFLDKDAASLLRNNN